MIRGTDFLSTRISSRRNVKRYARGLISIVFLLINLAPTSGVAAGLDPEVQWFVNLVQTNNGKAFCASSKLKWGEVSKAYSEYIKSHQLPDRLTDQQAVQVLARMYPCSGVQDTTNAAISKSIGKQIEVIPTGEYASINMRPMVAILQKLQSTSGHENDALLEDIEQNAGNYVPPVLMVLGVVRFRQSKIEDAIFWFNAGRLRAMFDAARCTDVSARTAVPALVHKTPKELLKAQFDDVARLRAIVGRVLKWDEATPQNYEYRWINLHGMGAINSGLGNKNEPAGPLTVSRESWNVLARQTREEFRTAMEKAIEQYQRQTRQSP